MKRLIVILLVLLPVLLMAQGQGVQIAPKGGVAMWKGRDVQSSIAPMGGLELGYVARWRVMQSVHLGFRMGVGASYVSGKMNAELTDQYDRKDYYTNTLQYTTIANVEEKHTQLNLEVPVLFAMQAGGFTLNVGPKLMLVASDKYNQTVSNSNIDVYYPAYRVTVHNELATGRLETPYTQSGTNALSKFNVLLSAEVGYEWQLGNRYSHRNEQYFGIQLFVDYGLWSTRTQQSAFLDVATITGPNQHPAVTVGAIPGACKLNYMSAGLRLYYQIQSVDYSGRGWHRRRR